MTLLVSSFLNVRTGAGDFILLLTKEHEDKPDLQRALDRAFPSLGDNVSSIWAVRSRREMAESTFIEIYEKPWGEEVRDMMGRTDAPFLLIIQNDFEGFEPNEHDWRIVWFAGIKSPRKTVEALMGALKLSSDRGESLFVYLDRLCEEDARTPYGIISSPNCRTPDISRRSRGRPGVFDICPAAKIRLEEGIRIGEFNREERGSISGIALKLQKEFPELRDFQKRSICTAITNTELL